MIDRRFIISSLAPLNGHYLKIDDLDAYADKVTARGKALTSEDPLLDGPAAYILYYDDGPDAFVTMTWTHPDRRGRGLMRQLLGTLLKSVRKDVRLEVHPDNPARYLYEQAGFVESGRSGGQISMLRRRRVAIMQPYSFAHLAYYHLVEAADAFVFYDDVHFIQRGWINRNALLGPKGRQPFTIPVSGGSQNALIKDVGVAVDGRWLDKFRSTLALSYSRAPFRDDVTALVIGVIENHTSGSIADLAIASVAAVYQHLGLPFAAVRSSEVSPSSRGLERSARLAAITKELGAVSYINAPGGRSLYSRDDFAPHGVELAFVDSRSVAYEQRPGQPFVEGLSIIDVLMFNAPDRVREMLAEFVVTPA